jgi:hypothetical protein
MQPTRWWQTGVPNPGAQLEDRRFRQVNQLGLRSLVVELNGPGGLDKAN